VPSADVIVVGAGIVGLSIARELRREGLAVVVIEKGTAGSEASFAAAGMLSAWHIRRDEPLAPLARASAQMYSAFVERLTAETGIDPHFRPTGTIVFVPPGVERQFQAARDRVQRLADSDLGPLEPALRADCPAFLLSDDHSVDNRRLLNALLQSARLAGVVILDRTRVDSVEFTNRAVSGVRTSSSTFPAGAVVNCAGAWAADLAAPSHPVPVRPRKGQMLALSADHDLLRHVVYGPGCYLVPRPDGRVLVGATQEDVGFDRRLDEAALSRLHDAAVALVPALAAAPVVERWAGFRPGTPDDLPLLGPLDGLRNYFIAAGHFRNGILLAPITARLLAAAVLGRPPEIDLLPFAPHRFASTVA
jgi:glycine oxidase